MKFKQFIEEYDPDYWLMRKKAGLKASPKSDKYSSGKLPPIIFDAEQTGVKIRRSLEKLNSQPWILFPNDELILGDESHFTILLDYYKKAKREIQKEFFSTITKKYNLTVPTKKLYDKFLDKELTNIDSLVFAMVAIMYEDHYLRKDLGLKSGYFDSFTGKNILSMHTFAKNEYDFRIELKSLPLEKFKHIDYIFPIDVSKESSIG